MNYIFWGFFFILFNLHITFGSTTINFIPIFAGYLLMIKAIDTLKHLAPRFARIRVFCFGMVGITGVLFLLNLVGITTLFAALFTLIRLILFILGLYPQYQMLRGLEEITHKHAVSSEKFMPIRVWLIVDAAHVLGYTIHYLGTARVFSIAVLAPFNFVALTMMIGGGAVFLAYLSKEEDGLEAFVTQP